MNLSPDSSSHSDVNFPQEELTAAESPQDLSIDEINPGFSESISTPVEASAAMGLDQGPANTADSQ